MRGIYAKVLIILLIIIALIANHSECASNSVTLLLKSYQEEYVLHEPLHFSGTLINNTGSNIHIGGMEKFNENMELLYLVIEYEDGSITKRRTCYYYETVLRSPYYEGQSLKTGESYSFDIYPNRTYSILNMKERNWTFPKPGIYLVTLAYAVDDFWQVLWKPEGDALYSNQITINIVPPTTPEKEILDTYWNDLIKDWDGKHLYYFDRALINNMIAKHSSEPLIKYMYYALLHNAYTYDGIDYQLADINAQHLMNNYPDFRKGQIRRMYAEYMIHSGRMNEALNMLNEALIIMPTLKDDYYFMKTKINLEAGDSSAFYKWKRRRNKDVDMKEYHTYKN